MMYRLTSAEPPLELSIMHGEFTAWMNDAAQNGFFDRVYFARTGTHYLEIKVWANGLVHHGTCYLGFSSWEENTRVLKLAIAFGANENHEILFSNVGGR